MNIRPVPLLRLSLLGILPALLLALTYSETPAQGWEIIGPDSSDWMHVIRLSGRIDPEGTLDLAAITYNGIATKAGGNPWNYTFRNIPNSVFMQGVDYIDLEFSPWEQDSMFVGFGYYNTEWIPVYLKTRWPLLWMPGPGSPGLIGGDCWFPPVSVVIPRTSDSTIYLTVCGTSKSTNRGATWIRIDSLWFNDHLFVGYDYYNEGGIYQTAHTDSGNTLFRSTNGGTTWSPLLASLPSLSYLTRAVSVVAFGDTIVVGLKSWWTDTTTTVGVVRTSDGGLTWHHVYAGGRIADLKAAATGFPYLYAVGEEGVFRSTDYGETWEMFNNGLPTNRITSLLLSPSPDTVFVSSEVYGVLKVWRFTVNVPDETPPIKFALHQNYPNPFNPSTTFSFDIHHSSFAILKVYDLLGREVATLVEEELSPGTYEHTFNGSNLSSGIYLARLNAGDNTQIRKIVLMR